MANRHRGEIEACLNGTNYKLCLTLGALAELESAFGDADMLALANRFEQGRLSAGDAMKIIGAGLRGGGHDIADDVVAQMRGEGGAAGFVDIVARLLGATFGGPVGAAAGAVIAEGVNEIIEQIGEGDAASGAAATAPFPGTT